MRKNLCKASVALLAAAALSLLAFAQTGGSPHKAINPPSLESSPNFSQGVVAGNTLYVSGQQGTDKSGKLLNGISDQTRGALEAIQTVLQAAGYNWQDVVQVNVYLADIKDWAAMNKVYTSILPSPRPARTTIQAAGLANNALIEVSAVAVKR